jgi:hypothetical protein
MTPRALCERSLRIATAISGLNGIGSGYGLIEKIENKETQREKRYV